jgi:hypothetical protein
MNNLNNIQKALLVMAVSLLAITAMNGAYDGYYRFHSCLKNIFLYLILVGGQFLCTAFFLFSLLVLAYLLVKRMITNKPGH